MSLLAPAALALAILLPVIVLLYLLKLRRTERAVPSTYLWRQMVRDVEANAPWQRLKFNLLMILQLLFLALVILALARPATPATGISARAAILILDTSASMAATDVTPSRLEAAKGQAHRLVDDMPDGANLTVIAAGRDARVAVSQTTDPRQVHQAIDALQPQAGNADLSVALQLASAIAARQPDAQVVVLSDGNASLPERVSVQGKLNYLPIGLEAENQAISLLNLEYEPTGGLSAFAQVANYGEQPARRRIAFYADGALVDSFDVDLLPGAEQSVIAGGILSGTQVIEAQLLSDDATIDYLSWDDHAQAVYQPAEPISVTLVSPGNLFLETALSLLPAVETTRLNPGSELNLPDADLTIFDGGTVPISTTLPTGSLMFVGPIRSTEFFTITGQLTAPRALPATNEEEMLRFVELGTVSILDSARIPLPDWASPVIVAEDTTVPSRQQPPLLFTGQPGGRRVAVMAFDLRHSDLPLQIAFPVLFSNLVDWLSPGRTGAIPDTITPGEVFSLQLPQGALGAAIVRPDGSRAELQAVDNRLQVAETGQLGVYRIELGGAGTVLYSVNLFSPQESSIRPADSLPVESAANTSGGLNDPADREWWRLLALLALALLFVEWLVYHRPALARLARRA